MTESKLNPFELQKKRREYLEKVKETDILYNEYLKQQFEAKKAKIQKKQNLISEANKEYNSIFPQYSKKLRMLFLPLGRIWHFGYPCGIDRAFAKTDKLFVWQVVRLPYDYWKKEIGKNYADRLEEELAGYGLYLGMDISEYVPDDGVSNHSLDGVPLF